MKVVQLSPCVHPLLQRVVLVAFCLLGVSQASRGQSLSAGGIHSCAVLSDGAVKCWGFGGVLGQGNMDNLGDGAGEMGDNLPSINLGAGRTAKQISAGSFHTCALLDNDTVKCWGMNSFLGAPTGHLGQGHANDLGDGPGEMGDNLPAIDLGTGRTVKQIRAGSTLTCALLDDNTVKCWGFGGTLGQGHTDNLGDGVGEMGDNLNAIDLGTGRTATQISAGGTHACALLDNGSVKCWGSGDSGQLGQGNSNTLGDGAGEMGDNLPAIDLGTGRTATQISAGSESTCALLDNGSVKCWGSGDSGRLGQGNTDNLGDGAGEMGDNLPAIDLGTGRTATQISAGGFQTCALLDNGSVKCWGSGSGGLLGQGNTDTLGDGAGEMGDNLPAIDLGTGRTATQISTGSFHTCALLDNGSVKCWGANNFSGTPTGHLGQGHTNDLGDGAGEMGDNLPAIDLGTGLTTLPVELTHFYARLNHNTLILSWNTASESNNAGFELQNQHASATTWNALAFINGHGTTTQTQTYTHHIRNLPPGTHRFRLKQIDFDGTFAYSPTTEVFIPLPEVFSLSAPYPNPFHDRTQLTLQVQHAERVRITVYDALGRAIETLHDGLLTAHEAHTFAFRGVDVASGWYFIEVQGETVRRTQPVLLAK